MPIKIFYAWQSDRPNNLNRGLIRRALDDAVRQIASDLDINDADRPDIQVDQDTQGVPGSPDIAQTILRKIDECDIFVADLTFIPSAEGDRETPNPNVLFEYGYALKGLSESRMVPIFNSAFGDPDDLPFDLRQKRCVTYSVSNDGDDKGAREERRVARDELISKLKTQVQTIINNLKEQEGEPEVDEYSPVEFPVRKSSFLSYPEDLGVTHSIEPEEDGRRVQVEVGPCLFLRLMPTALVPELSFVDAQGIVQYDLKPLAHWRETGCELVRNRYGAAACNVSSDDDKALTFSQLFRSGEIWGIDYFHAARKGTFHGKTVPVIDIAIAEKIFVKGLRNYLDVAKNQLRLPLPLNFIVGLDVVAGIRLYHSQNKVPFLGSLVSNEIIEPGEVDNYDIDVFDLLLPFFKRVFDDAGEIRPNVKGPV